MFSQSLPVVGWLDGLVAAVHDLDSYLAGSNVQVVSHVAVGNATVSELWSDISCNSRRPPPHDGQIDFVFW